MSNRLVQEHLKLQEEALMAEIERENRSSKKRKRSSKQETRQSEVTKTTRKEKTQTVLTLQVDQEDESSSATKALKNQRVLERKRFLEYHEGLMRKYDHDMTDENVKLVQKKKKMKDRTNTKIVSLMSRLSKRDKQSELSKRVHRLSKKD